MFLCLSIRSKTHFAFRFASPSPTPLKRFEKQPSGKRLRNISSTKNLINTFFFAGWLEYSRETRMREVTDRRDLVLELCNSVQHSSSSSSYDGTKFAFRARSLDAFLDITQISRHRSILEESESVCRILSNVSGGHTHGTPRSRWKSLLIVSSDDSPSGVSLTLRTREVVLAPRISRANALASPPLVHVVIMLGQTIVVQHGAHPAPEERVDELAGALPAKVRVV